MANVLLAWFSKCEDEERHVSNGVINANKAYQSLSDQLCRLMNLFESKFIALWDKASRKGNERIFHPSVFGDPASFGR